MTLCKNIAHMTQYFINLKLINKKKNSGLIPKFPNK